LDTIQQIQSNLGKSEKLHSKLGKKKTFRRIGNIWVKSISQIKCWQFAKA